MSLTCLLSSLCEQYHTLTLMYTNIVIVIIIIIIILIIIINNNNRHNNNNNNNKTKNPQKNLGRETVTPHHQHQEEEEVVEPPTWQLYPSIETLKGVGTSGDRCQKEYDLTADQEGDQWNE